jgi:class 3 adenylate cyclase/pimeloyl-ACP methyl ester carboxylesterase
LAVTVGIEPVGGPAIPETKYACSGDVHIAYQAWGKGPLTLVAVPPLISAVELSWDEPHCERFLRRFGSFCRVIHFDKRGCGASERVVGAPTLEERVDDLRAVMDAERIESAAIGGLSEGGPMCIMFAALYPERVSHLVLPDTTATFRGGGDYPHMPVPEAMTRFVDAWAEAWGTPATLTVQLMVPSMAGDERYLRWLNRYERASVSPPALKAIMRLNMEIDTRPLLSAIQVPTLVLHRRGDRAIPVENGRWLADHIAGAHYVEFDGDDHIPWIGDQDTYLDAIEDFLYGSHHRDIDRVLATVLFTDIVDSTATASGLGDRRWREVLDAHDRLAAREVERHGGRVVKATGDGLLATFDGPARAVRCARLLCHELSSQGVAIRAGVHTGEIELRGDDVGGIAVHIGARVEAAAGPGEVLVTRTVKDLVAGSGIVFADRGSHALKGVPEEWQLFAVTST